MANRAALLRQAQPGTVSRRGKHFLEFDLGGGQRRYISTIEPLHYGDGTQEIDTGFVADTGAFQWRMTAADFEVRTRDVFNSGNLVEFRKGAEWVVFNPLSLNWINQDSSTQQIATTQAVAAQVTDDRIDWPAAFGSGRHFRYQAHPSKLIKLLTVDALADLPTPTVTGTVHLMAEFQMTNSAGVDLWVDGVQWPRTNGVRVTTANAIEFRRLSDGVVLWRMDAPTAIDSSVSTPENPTTPTITGELQIRRQGPNFFASVRFPRAWVQAAVFPIQLDPTLTLQPDATAGKDTEMQSANATTNYGTSTNLGTGTNGGGNLERPLMQFDVSSIPSGATCDAATLTLYGASADTWGRAHVAYELRSDRAGWTESGATWNTYDGTNNWGTAGASNTTTDRQSTTLASFNWASAQGYFDINLNTTAVATWFGSSNANYGFLLQDATETDWQRNAFWSSDQATAALRPEFVVDYTEGGGGGNPPDTPSIVSVTVLGGA